MTNIANNIKTETNTNALLDSDYLHAHGELPVPIGRNLETGRLFIEDLSTIPNMIISGDSGSGKTSFVQTILAIMINNKAFDEIGFVIYDSKYVEYSHFSSVPHLIYPITNDREELVDYIEKLSIESQERLSMLASVGMRNIEAYNNYCLQNNGNKLKRVFIIIDDYSTLSLDKERFAKLLSIVSNGRISGIHSILVTSRLTPKSLQKELISCIPCKITFHLSSKTDSKIILDRFGAENLYVPGGIIYKNQNRTVNCQCVYATYDNIKSFIKYYKYTNSYSLQFLSDLAENCFNKKKNKNSNLNAKDSLFNQAVSEAIKVSEITSSYLQRKLYIGYNRAIRLIDEMESLGFVAKGENSRGYQVQIPSEFWEKYLKDDGFVYIPNLEQLAYQPISKNNSATIQSIKELQDDTEVLLRDYPEFDVGGTLISIKDNEIIIKKDAYTELGFGTYTFTLKGSYIGSIILKKATNQAKGYFQLVYTGKVRLNPNNAKARLLDINKIGEYEYSYFEYDKSTKNIVESFLYQLSKDIGKEIIER